MNSLAETDKISEGRFRWDRLKLKRNVYWVGALDWNIRDFHGYSTPKGTTYNAYLVIDEKIALFDTVKSPFKKDLIDKHK